MRKESWTCLCKHEELSSSYLNFRQEEGTAISRLDIWVSSKAAWESIMSHSSVLQCYFFEREMNSCFCKNGFPQKCWQWHPYKGLGLMQILSYWWNLVCTGMNCPYRETLDVTKYVCKNGGGGSSHIVRCISILNKNKCVWTVFCSLSRSFRP